MSPARIPPVLAAYEPAARGRTLTLTLAELVKSRPCHRLTILHAPVLLPGIPTRFGPCCARPVPPPGTPARVGPWGRRGVAGGFPGPPRRSPCLSWRVPAGSPRRHPSLAPHREGLYNPPHASSRECGQDQQVCLSRERRLTRDDRAPYRRPILCLGRWPEIRQVSQGDLKRRCPEGH